MAVVTTKSGQITNRDASPPALSDGAFVGAKVWSARGVCAIASGDSVGSKYLFCSVPSNAVPVSLLVTSPDIGVTTAGDIGLYQTTENGGAVVDADLFASALALNAGALTRSEALYESAVIASSNGEQRLWEILGLSADSARDYDVVLTLTGAADAAGSVLVEFLYTV